MNFSPAGVDPVAAAVRAPAATDALNAVLFREILKPLAAALGPVGDVVLDSVVDGLFVKPQR